MVQPRLTFLSPSTHGRRGGWPTWTFSLWGKLSTILFVTEVRPWPILSKKISSWSKRSFGVPTRTCSRLGWGFLADPGWGTLPVPKETTQITSSSQHKSHKSRKSDNTNQYKSHPSNPSSYSHWLLNPFHPIHHIQPFLHWWDDTAHHCCSANLLGMRHIACLPTRPFSGTCLHDCKDMAEGAYLR